MKEKVVEDKFRKFNWNTTEYDGGKTFWFSFVFLLFCVETFHSSLIFYVSSALFLATKAGFCHQEMPSLSCHWKEGQGNLFFSA